MARKCAINEQGGQEEEERRTIVPLVDWVNSWQWGSDDSFIVRSSG